MLKKISVLVFISASFGSLFVSCGGGGEETIEMITREETEDSTHASAEVITDITLIRANIPNPSEMFAAISAAGTNYDKSLLNSPGKASSYSTNYQTALNLGVYGADLGYAAMYNQNQDVIAYGKNVTTLAEKVGVGNAFNQNFIDLMSGNMGADGEQPAEGAKNDSTANDAHGNAMTLAINEAFTRAERNLKSDESLSKAALMITGGWIEGLYIATKCAKKAGNNASLNAKVWNQIFSFKYVLQLLKEFESNADCKKALDELKEIGELLGGYVNKPKLDSKDLPDIEAKVTSLRNRII